MDQVRDDDGMDGVTFAYQWQWRPANSNGAFTDIRGAIGETFTPTTNDLKRVLRVNVSYTDNHGTRETVSSAQTAVVIGQPNAPRISGVTAGNAQVTVRWAVPTDNGGSAVTGYNVQVIAGGQVQRTIEGIAGSATSTVVTGLTNGTSYTFKVQAVNVAGPGPLSAASATVRPAVPDTVQPQTVTRAPAVAATRVALTAGVSVVFSEPVTGVSASTMTLRNEVTKAAVPARVVYDSAKKRATLTPTKQLIAGHRHTVSLTNGIKDPAGNALAVTSWSFTTMAQERTSDFTGDGRADVLSRDRSGKLWLHPGNGKGGVGARKLAGNGGWNSMTAITGAGDVTGDGKADMWARDTAGRLWLYPGTGKGTFSARKQVGTGWNGMTAIIGAGDLTGDHRGDLIARDRAGKLWLYPGNGKGGVSVSARKQVGFGWNGMSAMLTAGDANGDGRPDLYARDRAGKLWLYPGNGKGGFSASARKQVGTGWNGMSALLVPGDISGDGKADLLARDSSGGLWMYPSTGKASFGARKQVSTGWGSLTALL
jgi:hypothetical protein